MPAGNSSPNISPPSSMQLPSSHAQRAHDRRGLGMKTSGRARRRLVVLLALAAAAASLLYMRKAWSMHVAPGQATLSSSSLQNVAAAAAEAKSYLMAASGLGAEGEGEAAPVAAAAGTGFQAVNSWEQQEQRVGAAAQPLQPVELPPTAKQPGTFGSLKKNTQADNYSILAIVATFDDDLSWLLDKPRAEQQSVEELAARDASAGAGAALPPLIVPTEVYQIADLGADCEPAFPRLPRELTSDTLSAVPTWPAWAREHVDRKCSTKDEAETWSVFDEERAATLAAGLPWKGRTQPGVKQQVLLPVALPSQAATAAANPVTPGGAAGTKAGTAGGAAVIDVAAGDSASTLQQKLIAASDMASAAAVKSASKQQGRRLRQAAAAAAANSTETFSIPDFPARADLQPPLPASAVVTIPGIFPYPLQIVPGQGRESLAYLTAVIEHYDELAAGGGPSLLLFMHGHKAAWHTFALGQDWALRRLRALGPRNLTQGFMQLGCMHREESNMLSRVVDANHVSANGPRWRESMVGHFMQAWLEPGGLGEVFNATLPPPYIQAPCCATFAVTRDAVLRRPRAFYEGLRNWLLRTDMEKYWAGVAIEFSWHMAFTHEAVYDPPVEQCRQELYEI